MLVNFKDMLNKARKEKYAVAHFNINNLEWAKYILEECQDLKNPTILGVSESAVKYMGGYNTVASMVKSLVEDLNITVPVCLHLDHGTFEGCLKAIEAGFSSVMIDASLESLEKNIEITKEVVEQAHKKNISVEAEIGHIDNTGISNTEFYAKVDECQKLYKQTNIDALAPALGSVHGLYKGKPNLNFRVMKEISETLQIPLVLHGGSGIPDEQIKQAISCGISKININTDLQIVWARAVRKYLEENNEVYDPRKIIGSGKETIKQRVKEIVALFGTTI